MSADTIRDDIPPPLTTPRMSWKVLEALEPGQSIDFPGTIKDKVRNALSQVQRRTHGSVFCSRTVGDVVRVWRVK
jgi:hypothetical protein